MSVYTKSDIRNDHQSERFINGTAGRTRVLLTPVILAGALMLGGCLDLEIGGSESTYDAENPSTPGDYVYKGQVDPLTATSAADRADALKQRFMQVQGRE